MDTARSSPALSIAWNLAWPTFDSCLRFTTIRIWERPFLKCLEVADPRLHVQWARWTFVSFLMALPRAVIVITTRVGCLLVAAW